MKTRELFNFWEKELLRINNELNIETQISDENTHDEEYYFYIKISNEYWFYCFYDNWGKGVGIHKKSNQNSVIYYLEDINIKEENKDGYFLQIMKEVIAKRKIFWIDNTNEINIEWNNKINEELLIDIYEAVKKVSG